MKQALKTTVLALCAAMLLLAQTGLTEARGRHGGWHGGYRSYGYHGGYHHGHHGGGYYWWPFAIAGALAVTGALLAAPYYSYNYYAPPAPAYYRRPCQWMRVQELNYYRQPVLVTRLVCYDQYGNAYIAR
jgi:hypothetical protein